MCSEDVVLYHAQRWSEYLCTSLNFFTMSLISLLLVVAPLALAGGVNRSLPLPPGSRTTHKGPTPLATDTAVTGTAAVYGINDNENSNGGLGCQAYVCDHASIVMDRQTTNNIACCSTAMAAVTTAGQRSMNGCRSTTFGKPTITIFRAHALSMASPTTLTMR